MAEFAGALRGGIDCLPGDQNRFEGHGRQSLHGTLSSGEIISGPSPLAAAERRRADTQASQLHGTTDQAQKGINFYDLLSRLGQPTEPLGWDVQVTYALALIRSGNDEQAQKRINLLHQKVSINHTHNPKGSLDYGPEAGTGRYRDYVHYLQLCEVLHALRAAVSNDHTSARKHIENARKHREPLSPEAAPLVAEIVLRIEEQKD